MSAFTAFKENFYDSAKKCEKKSFSYFLLFVRDWDGNRISNIYLIFLFPKECRDNEEKSDRLFEKLVKNGDLDRLLISAYDKTKKPFLDIPQGGAFQQQFFTLKFV